MNLNDRIRALLTSHRVEIDVHEHLRERVALYRQRVRDDRGGVALVTPPIPSQRRRTPGGLDA